MELVLSLHHATNKIYRAAKGTLCHNIYFLIFPEVCFFAHSIALHTLYVPPVVHCHPYPSGTVLHLSRPPELASLPLALTLSDPVGAQCKVTQDCVRLERAGPYCISYIDPFNGRYYTWVRVPDCLRHLSRQFAFIELANWELVNFSQHLLFKSDDNLARCDSDYYEWEVELHITWYCSLVIYPEYYELWHDLRCWDLSST